MICCAARINPQGADVVKSPMVSTLIPIGAIIFGGILGDGSAFFPQPLHYAAYRA